MRSVTASLSAEKAVQHARGRDSEARPRTDPQGAPCAHCGGPLRASPSGRVPTKARFCASRCRLAAVRERRETAHEDLLIALRQLADAAGRIERDLRVMGFNPQRRRGVAAGRSTAGGSHDRRQPRGHHPRRRPDRRRARTVRIQGRELGPLGCGWGGLAVSREFGRPPPPRCSGISTRTGVSAGTTPPRCRETGASLPTQRTDASTRGSVTTGELAAARSAGVPTFDDIREGEMVLNTRKVGLCERRSPLFMNASTPARCSSKQSPPTRALLRETR